MLYGQFEYITELQYQNKSLTAQVKAFRSGEKYSRMNSEFRSQLAERDLRIRRLKCELGDANCRTVSARKNYQQVIEDMEDEYKKELAKKDREIKAMEERALRAERQRDDAQAKLTEKNRELYRALTELEEEKGKNLKLKAQINRDYENSSVPSSMKPNHKKIANNREKTGKRPGGQPGHKGHTRKKQTPTKHIDIPAPEEYLDRKKYRSTGETITKQMVGLHVSLVTCEYSTPEFRHLCTGQRVHAEFPEGVVNDVNYDGSIKAFAFLLNNHCNVSILKVSDFLSELTDGGLKISAGMINGLSKQFSSKTEAEQKKAFADMLLSPVMNTDFTSARVNGKNMNVAVCATPETVLYFAREHKGHKGVKGTPIESYQGTMVNDHDKTFYNYGGDHQECLDHPLRYLIGHIENEPDRKWHGKMRELLREMIHFRKGLDPDDDRDPDQINPGKVAVLEKKYDEILELAKEEYEYEPPNEYYMDGFNLYKKLFNYRDNHLLFLHDRRIPYSNSRAERLLRIFKRKQRQVMTFRSWDGLDYLCKSLGTIASLRAEDKNLYASVAMLFDKPIPPDNNIAN
jgi:hypothetical protein